MKNVANFVLSQDNRFTNAISHRRDNRQATIDDPFKLTHLTYGFGKKLCPGNELLPKRILLSKKGNKVYFCKRDANRKADLLMSV